MFCPGTLGPHCGRPGPHTGGGGGGRIPLSGSGWHPGWSWTNLGGPDCISRGPALSHGGPDSLLRPWGLSISLDTWQLWTRPCGGVRRCCGPRVVVRGWGESWLGPTRSTLTTRLRDSRMGTASLYSSKGYPSFRVPTCSVTSIVSSSRRVCTDGLVDGAVVETSKDHVFDTT
jgi:hypothetical protein